MLNYEFRLLIQNSKLIIHNYLVTWAFEMAEMIGR